MEGRAADRNHWGEGQGGTHTTGNHRGGGGIPWGGGGRGGLAALHHIYVCVCLCVCHTHTHPCNACVHCNRCICLTFLKLGYVLYHVHLPCIRQGYFRKIEQHKQVVVGRQKDIHSVYEYVICDTIS